MVLGVNNSITSSDNELNGRAQNGAVTTTEPYKTTKTERSFFAQLERGPAKVPPQLDNNYDLDESFKQAFQRAVGFANKVLLDDDLSMSLSNENDGKSLAIVTNTENKKVVQEYDPLQVLQMYSSNYDLQGIVIDALI